MVRQIKDVHKQLIVSAIQRRNEFSDFEDVWTHLCHRRVNHNMSNLESGQNEFAISLVYWLISQVKSLFGARSYREWATSIVFLWLNPFRARFEIQWAKKWGIDDFAAANEFEWE